MDSTGQIPKIEIDSLSNGCLMWITPLSVWAHKLSPSNIEKVSFLDSQLTHSDLIALWTVATYNIGIAYLINNDGDSEGAIEAMRSYIESTED